MRALRLIFSSCVLLAACQERQLEPPSSGGSGMPSIELQTISSPPDRITGSDVLLRLAGVNSVAAASELGLLLNEQPAESARFHLRNGAVEVLLDGLQPGENSLQLIDAAGNSRSTLKLTAYPITGPVFSGPQQYPFVCSSVLEWNVQPLVDHEESWGFPVMDASGAILGYSKDCSVETFVEFHYMSTDGTYAPLPADGSRPGDIRVITLTDGREADFVIRWERGTINRFLYSFATLASIDDARNSAGPVSAENWNGRLLLHFEGGVGVGHFQGRMNVGRARLSQALEAGYAVAYSTGNRTGEHYNLQLGGETALMLKEHFIKRFGEPVYTVAVGGSGGAIQQYVYAQNHPGLIDAGVPQYSYPDMVTQIIHVGDCELLEHYMDVTDGSNPRWQETVNRSLLTGFNATDDIPDPLAALKRSLGYSSAPGSTKCIPAWRGLTPLSMNPHYGQVREQQQMVPADIMSQVRWTHYDDLRNVYGVDAEGHARTLWDNVGVQYGLLAFTADQISEEEFLDLNEKIGGWKQPKDMVQEGFPFLGDPTPENFDPWSRRNMILGDGSSPAPRTVGDTQGIAAAYQSGMVFDGTIDIPVIDWRHYLEHVLDMHNSHQSFSVRQRIRNAVGHSDNQLIWFTDARPEAAFEQTAQALVVLDEWLMNIRRNPQAGAGANRPASAVDSCFDTSGELLAAGDDVWAGILDAQAPGPCTQRFPTYSTSRMQAGAPIEGSIFKCALKTVDTALADGTYGSWNPGSAAVTRLKAIFPEGVCDYSRPDQGRP